MFKKSFQWIGWAAAWSAVSWAAAAPGGLSEKLPPGVTPDAAQQQLVRFFAQRVDRVEATYDRRGHVHHLALQNDKDRVQRVAQDKAPTLMSPKDFQRLAEFPSIKSLLVFRPTVTDDAFGVLEKLPDLEAFRIEYYGSHGVAGQTHRFMLHLNHCPKLKALELKHLFRLEGTSVDRLIAMPHLEYLELDVDSATPAALTFLEKCPNINEVEIHRTSMDDEQIGHVIDLLPKLRRFVVKPGYSPKITAAHLAHLKRLKHLEVVGLHIWRKAGSLPYENGLEHLAAMPNVKVVEFPGCYVKPDSPEVQKLRAARPDLQFKGLQ